MKKYRHSILWGNPYIQPPKGLPRILVEIETTTNRPPEWFKRKQYAILDRLSALGISSYHLGWDFLGENQQQKRTWSDEAKKRNRMKRLRRRMEKKFSIPQLLEDAINSAIAKNPTYYS